jgi:hypothetical protein
MEIIFDNKLDYYYYYCSIKIIGVFLSCSYVDRKLGADLKL